jgi:hypothetical protein
VASLKAVRAAPAIAGNGPLNFEQLPGRLDVHATKFNLQIQHLTTRLGLSPVRAGVVAELAYGGGAHG